MTTQAGNESVCCPQFDPGPWDDRMIEWKNKKFVKDNVFTFFFMPVNFGRVMRRIDKKVRAAGAGMQDYLALSDHTSKWNMDLYVAVDREVAGIENTTLTGNFYSKVYEGPFNATAKWCHDFENIVKARGLGIKRWFMWYTTCPKCAKKYGKNYVAIISELS